MEVRKSAVIYGGKYRITFIEDKDVWPEIHEYRIEKKKGDGWGPERKVDLTVSGVTKVLDKPALVGWATKMCAEFVKLFSTRLAEKVVVSTLTGLRVDEIELDAFVSDMKAHGKGKKKEAATIGTMAHAWVEGHIKFKLGLEAKEPEMPVNAAVNNAIKAFLAWEESHHVVYLHTERLVYSEELDVAGQLDIEAKVDGEIAILDNKTSSGIYPEMEYQTAGYQHACEEEAVHVKQPVKYGARWILRLDKLTGEFEAKRVTDHEVAIAAYKACHTLAKIALDKRRAAEQAKDEQRAIRNANKAPRVKKGGKKGVKKV